MKHHGLLITDLDNTLYDFPAYYEAGLKSAVEAINSTFSADTDTTVGWLRQIYGRHGSIEYPFAMEELPPALLLPQNERREFVQVAMREFWTAATDSLALYPTVERALQDLHYQGIAIVAYTDAPIHEAMRRLRKLGINRYLSGLVARTWFRRRSTATFVANLSSMPGYSRPARHLQIVWRLPDPERKPSVAVYQRIADAFSCDPSAVTVIGDSIPRDLLPAQALGMKAVWARYGMRQAADEGLLQLVVPSRLPELSTLPEPRGAMIVDVFEDVSQQLPVQQILRVQADVTREGLDNKCGSK